MLILTGAEVEALLDYEELVGALAPAMADLSAGRAILPPRAATLLDAEAASGLLDMPSYVPSMRALTSKLVTAFPGNAGTGIPVRQAVVVVFDPDTGSPAAVVDGTYLTAARTGACSALSARLLARDDARVLAVIGTGIQAQAHLRAAVATRPYDEVRLAGSDHTRTRSVAAALSGTVGREVTPVDGDEAAVRGADVVCAATYRAGPVIRRAWLAAGAHVTSVGYKPGGREVDDELIRDAALFVEQRAAALNAAPPNYDLIGLTADDIAAELGEVVDGRHPGRTGPEQVTLYKSVGVAVQDSVAAALVIQAARRRGVGQDVAI